MRHVTRAAMGHTVGSGTQERHRAATSGRRVKSENLTW